MFAISRTKGRKVRKEKERERKRCLQIGLHTPEGGMESRRITRGKVIEATNTNSDMNYRISPNEIAVTLNKERSP